MTKQGQNQVGGTVLSWSNFDYESSQQIYVSGPSLTQHVLVSSTSKLLVTNDANNLKATETNSFVLTVNNLSVASGGSISNTLFDTSADFELSSISSSSSLNLDWKLSPFVANQTISWREISTSSVVAGTKLINNTTSSLVLVDTGSQIKNHMKYLFAVHYQCSR